MEITQLKSKAQELLDKIKAGTIPATEAETMIAEMRNAIKADPAAGKELGQLMASLNQALKSQPQLPDINWVAVANGLLAIGHKPGGKVSFEGLKQSGVTAVVTLLQENEGAEDIGRQANKVEINWVWFPFSASNPLDGEDAWKVSELYKNLEAQLNAGGKIYLHCSAGIHRTGMITYGLLRYIGNEKKLAMQVLHSLREVTFQQAGEERLAWGDQFSPK